MFWCILVGWAGSNGPNSYMFAMFASLLSLRSFPRCPNTHNCEILPRVPLDKVVTSLLTH
jgi:hypothetical protein